MIEITSKGRIAEKIPVTISKVAQDYLRTGMIFAVDPTMYNWTGNREAIYQGYSALNDKIKNRYVEHIDEFYVSNIPAFVLTPKGYDSKRDSEIILYLHGGAYVFHNPLTTLFTWAPLSFECGIKVCAVDYRLAPECPYPAAPDDCYLVYKDMLTKFNAKNIVVFGDSAGGSLALTTILRSINNKLKVPSALVLVSPWADITDSGDSYYANAGLDAAIHYDMNLRKPAQVYVGKNDPKTPDISPVYAEYTKEFPPTMIITGTRDLFLSNCVRLYRKMKNAGVKVDLNVFECMWHDFICVPDMPETAEAYTDMRIFINKYMR